MHKYLSTLLSFIFFSFTPSNTQEFVELKLNLKEGDKYFISIPININMDITMSLDNQVLTDFFPSEGIKEEIEIHEEKGKKNKRKLTEELKATAPKKPTEERIQMTVNLEMFLKFKVIEFIDDVYNLQVSYDRFKIQTVSNDTTYVIDTKMGSDGLSKEMLQEWKVLKKITDLEFFIEVTSLGDILKIRNYERINSVLEARSKTSLTGLEEEKFFAYEYIDLDKLKSTWQSVFKIYPDKPVAVGDSWVINTFDEDKFAPMKITDIYTLKEMTDSIYIIEYISNMSDNPTEETINPIIISGTGKGVINLSRSDNFQQTHPYSLEIDMNMNFMGINMDTKTSGKDVYKVERIN